MSSSRHSLVHFMVCIMFAGFGYLILKIREKNATICNISAPLLCGKLALAALSLMSEAFMLSIMFAENTELFNRLGFCILAFRIGNILPSGLLLAAIFSSSTQISNEVKSFDSEHFLQMIYPYTVLFSYVGLPTNSVTVEVFLHSLRVPATCKGYANGRLQDCKDMRFRNIIYR